MCAISRCPYLSSSGYFRGWDWAKVAFHRIMVWFLIARRGCRNVTQNSELVTARKSLSYTPLYLPSMQVLMSSHNLSNYIGKESISNKLKQVIIEQLSLFFQNVNKFTICWNCWVYNLLDRFAAPLKNWDAGDDNFSSEAVIMVEVGKWLNNWLITCVKSLAEATRLGIGSTFFCNCKYFSLIVTHNAFEIV